MSVIAFALMLAAGIALFLPDTGAWFLGLFIAGLIAQAATIYNGVPRWRRKASD